MRRAIEWAGRVLVTSGALLLLFVAYQLWGTNILQAQAQNDLKDDFREEQSATPSTTTTVPEEEPEPTTTTTTAPKRPKLGKALGIVRIPAIGLDAAFVEGVGRDELAKGPGHYPHSPMPGYRGNAAMAGHRTTYGAPFNRLDELKTGDTIEVETLEGTFVYTVDGTGIVSPQDVSPVVDKGDNRITLTTCNPKYSARERLIVTGTLVGKAVDKPAPKPPEEKPDPVLPGEEIEVPERLDGTSESGLHVATWSTVLWTLLLIAVGAGWWWSFRQWRGWPTRLGGILPFLFVLFFFFGEVERMLPANF